MLKIDVPGGEYFDESTNTFFTIFPKTLELEHSLISLDKWESKWKIPFLGKEEKTLEQCTDYVRCMTLTKNVDPLVYRNLTEENFKAINQYIEDPMTATWFRNDGRPAGRDIITSEIIYYWMVTLNIPFECRQWHLNKLLTLIRVCNLKNSPPKMMRGKELLNHNRRLNEARKNKLHSRG